MSPRPLIFVSAASQELHSARQLVSNTLQFLGYEPICEDIFGTDTGDLRRIIRRKIDQCQGVVQLVGSSYGSEPQKPDPQFGRASYTQYEALYARARGKKVWYLLLDEQFPSDAHAAEPDKLKELQTAYRSHLMADTDLYHPVHSREALEAQVLKLRDDLARLRSGIKQWALGVVCLLVVLVGLCVWLVERETRVRDELHILNQAMLDFPCAQSLAQPTNASAANDLPGDSMAEAHAYSELARRYGIDESVLRKKLPHYAQELRNSATATPLEQASAAYVAKDYAEAERLALRAAADAETVSPVQAHTAFAAWRLAGWAAQEQIRYFDALKHLQAAERLTNRQQDPIQWASAEFSIAIVLSHQGRHAEAEQLDRVVLTTRKSILGEKNPDTLSCWNNLAVELDREGKYQEAESELHQVLTIRRRVLGAEHPDVLASRNNLSVILCDEGNYSQAEHEARAVLAIRIRVLGPDQPDTLASRCNLAADLTNEGKYSAAEQELRSVLAIQERVLGKEHPDTLRSRSNLAVNLEGQSKYTDADREYRAVLAARVRVLGPAHPDTLATKSNLAANLDDQGKYDEAEQEIRSALVAQLPALGEEHPETLRSRSNLAVILDDEGNHADAEQVFSEVLAIRQRVLGPEHPDTLISRCNLAGHWDDAGQYPRAEQEYRAVLAIRQRVLGANHPDTLTTRSNLAVVLDEQGKILQAEREYRAILTIREQVLGRDHPDTLASQECLAANLADQGRYTEALDIYRNLITSRQQVLGRTHPDTLAAISGLARTLHHLNQDQDAEPLARFALSAMQSLDPNDSRVLTARGTLASISSALGDTENSELEFLRLLTDEKRVLGPTHRFTLRSEYGLAECLRAAGKLSEAQTLADRALASAERTLGPDHPCTKRYRAFAKTPKPIAVDKDSYSSFESFIKAAATAEEPKSQ